MIRFEKKMLEIARNQRSEIKPVVSGRGFATQPGNAANQAQQAVGEFTQMRGLAGRETSGLAPAGLKRPRCTTLRGRDNHICDLDK